MPDAPKAGERSFESEVSEAQSFARLVSLEAECARLRVALGVGSRGPSLEGLPESVAFSLFERHATDFFSVHAADGTYVYASPACERLFGHTPASLIGRSAYDFIHPEDIARVEANHSAHSHAETRPPLEYRLRRADSSYVWVETISDAPHRGVHVEQILCVTRDVSERRAASEAQARLIRALEDRIEQVRTLTGLLPICAWCKSIRDDEGYWHEVDAYLAKRTAMEFTHGACPSCAATLRKRDGAVRP